MQNFELQFWDVGGCVGYPLSSKSILKVVSQMVRLCDYATVLFSYLHIGFLTSLALLKKHSEMEHPVYVLCKLRVYHQELQENSIENSSLHL